MKSPRKLDKLFEGAHDDLAILITRTKQLRRLTYLIREQLDAQLAPHCYLGNISQNSITLLVDSAAWASRLRFESSHLPDKLRSVHPAFARLERIDVKIITDLHTELTSDGETTPARLQLNSENANIINSLADSIEDEALQNALHRLARRARAKT